MSHPHCSRFDFYSLRFGAITLFFVLFTHPVLARENYDAVRNIKGFTEWDISTSVATRRIFEEISPGDNFTGDATSTRVMLKISVKPWRPAEFYLKGGMANLEISEFNDYRGDYSFAYGGGLSLRLYELEGPRRFQIFLRGDVTAFKTDDTVLIRILSEDVFVKEKIRWREYTIDSFGMWRSRNWEPYLGMRFSWLDSSDTINDPRVGRLTLEEDRNLGLMTGTNIYFDLRENFALNLEATIIDQFLLKVGFKLWY